MPSTNFQLTDWSINRVKRHMETAKQKEVTQIIVTQLPEQNRTPVVVSYIHCLSEAVTRAYRRHGISTAMKPFQSIRSLLVHPKEKHRQQDACECVYKIPCKKYTGETGTELLGYGYKNTDKKLHSMM